MIGIATFEDCELWAQAQREGRAYWTGRSWHCPSGWELERKKECAIPTTLHTGINLADFEPTHWAQLLRTLGPEWRIEDGDWFIFEDDETHLAFLFGFFLQEYSGGKFAIRFGDSIERCFDDGF